MQTTLRIRDDLYREAKAEAAREGITLTRYIESALSLRLAKSRSLPPGTPHPFPIHQPHRPIDLTSEELKRLADEEELQHDLKKLGIRPADT